jgi:hypothetical protein
VKIFWRLLATVLALASLVFTVPAALWICVIVIAAIVRGNGYPPPIWADTVGWIVMIAVLAATIWAVYRLWKPYLMEMNL